ncbi:hypothetical protein [Nitrincola sp. MINF-07-Sa-05]|uniref:hypothetical protein n=1 Tax=Nitrincola salilacus TaxID=3400273 RepID=UPI003917E68E
MSKSEWIWVAIRLFGIYLLVLAFISIPDAIGNIYALVYMLDTTGNSSDSASMVNSLRKSAKAAGSKATAQLVIFLVAAYYFLRHGKAIHKLANHEKNN